MIKIKFLSENAKKIWDNGKKFNKASLNAGFDVYTTQVDSVLEMQPGDIHMFPTGIALQSDKYHFIVKERGSTGTKGLSVRAGVIDANYTGEIFICINNTSNKKLIIGTPELMNAYSEFQKDAVYYDVTKAIAQLIPVPIEKINDYDIKMTDELEQTDRGDGKLGSTRA